MVDWESMQLHGSTVFFQGTMVRRKDCADEEQPGLITDFGRTCTGVTQDTPVQMHTYAVDADASSWTSWLNGDAPVSSVKWAAPRRLTASGKAETTLHKQHPKKTHATSLIS